jgi:hypothetical protein
MYIDAMTYRKWRFSRRFSYGAVLATRQKDYNGEPEGVINCRFVLTPECAVALAQALLAAVPTKPEPDAAGAACRVVN